LRDAFVIHCHFYQPPRFDPFTLEFPREPLAYPYRNWNERIASECYSKLVKVLEYLSNNWGPTLLYWMRKEAPSLFEDLVSKVRESKTAIAHPYYHVILPLTPRVDRLVLLEWGRRIFERIFGYKPYGVWLPETAVNTQTLRDVEKVGFRFVVVGEDQVEPQGAGFFRVSHIKDLFVFAFNRELSGLLSFSSEDFYCAENLEKLFNSADVPFVALDGETFGHHKKGAELGLRDFILKNRDKMAHLNKMFLKAVPDLSVKIRENTSWSCPHGLLRWMDHCGCNTGQHPHWNQRWRRPLREALNWLSVRIDELFYEKGRVLFDDPFQTLLDYIYFFDEPSDENLNAVKKHLIKEEELIHGLLLLEMKNCALAMFTSCGWFFDDISGHETVMILKFAKRAMDIAYEHFGVWLEDGFLNILSRARSNLKDMGNGRDIYWRFVKGRLRLWREILVGFIKEHDIKDSLSLGRFFFEFFDVRVSRNGDFELKSAQLRVLDIPTTRRDMGWVIVISFGGNRFVHIGKHSPQEVDGFHHLFTQDLLSFFLKFFSRTQL